MTTRSVAKPKPEDLQRHLREHGGSVTATAAGLGVHRTTLHGWMREYGIKVQRTVEVGE